MEKKRYKKIRGQNRLLRAIDKWRINNLSFDKDELFENDALYVKFRVHPWSKLSTIGPYYDEPSDIFREYIIRSLVDIYDLWKTELDKLDCPYYLKIWIMFPNFRNSQVVCAINKKIDWYENIFFEGNRVPFPNGNFSADSISLLEKFNWSHKSYECRVDNDYVGTETDYRSKEDYLLALKWFTEFLSSKHRIELDLDNEPIHFQKIDDVWVGEK